MTDHDGVADTTVDLDPTWGIQGKLHGGYLLATMVATAMRSADPDLHPDPIAASAVYSAPPNADTATVRTRPLRAGRTVATYHLTLEQDGVRCVEVFLTAGRLPASDAEPRFVSPAAAAPSLPSPQECLTGPERAGAQSASPLGAKLDVRLDPASAPPPHGPGGALDMRGWSALRGEWDPVIGQFVLADAMPPTTLDLGVAVWVPTLQLQVLIRRRPVGTWFATRQQTQLLDGGLLDEDCTLWDERGRLVTQARQLAAVRLPPGT